MTIQGELAEELLESVARELEATFREHRYCNTFLARYASDASQALCFPQLTVRFESLLKKSRWKGFYGGLITNIRLPWFVPRGLRQLRSIDKINEDYPVFTADFAVQTFAKYNSRMLPGIEHGFDAILSRANTELDIEEVALSQALLGQYLGALETASRLKEVHRQNNVRFVIAIEQYRQNQIDAARTTCSWLSPELLRGWARAQFAMGICNRVPSCPYPYPDY